MSFWVFLWFIFVIFCLVAYLMVMFSILVDETTSRPADDARSKQTT